MVKGLYRFIFTISIQAFAFSVQVHCKKERRIPQKRSTPFRTILHYLFVFAAATAATGATAVSSQAARTAVGTADTFFSAFLCFINIQSCQADYNRQYRNNNDIFHGNYSLFLFARSNSRFFTFERIFFLKLFL